MDLKFILNPSEDSRNDQATSNRPLNQLESINGPSSVTKHQPENEVSKLPSRGPAKCSICNKPFSSKDAVRQHIQRIHDRLRPFECTHGTCELTFCTGIEMRRHIQSVHGSGRPHPFKCSECDYFAGTKRELNLHFERIHVNGKTPKPGLWAVGKGNAKFRAGSQGFGGV